MAKLQLLAGTTSKDVNVFVQNNSVTTGAGLTGLAYNSGSLTAYYHRQGASSATSITLATKTVGTWATGGFVAVDGTNMPGLYELGIPDAALASGAKWVIVMLKGATNMAPVVLEIELTAVDNQDSVRGGMTALPNAAAAASGGLPTVDGSNAVKVQSGTAANQISLSSGLVTLAGVTHTGAVIPTVTTTTTATNVTTVNGLAAGVVTAASIASDAITAAKIADGAIDAATFATGAITATAIAADAITDAKVASDVTIASVTGAVGSVTGAVTVGTISSGVITATSIASGAITAAKFATDAIDATALAASAVTEIQTGLATPTNITAGTITTVTNLTNAPTSGDLTTTMKASVTAAVPTSSAIATAVWAVLTSALTTTSSVGKLIADNLNATISSVYARLGAPAGASIAADLVAIEAETANIQTRIPAALISGRIDANVGAMSNNVVTAAAINTNAIDADALAADAVAEIAASLVSLSAPTVEEIDTQLSTTHGAGAWSTATGFATPTNVDSSTSSITGSIGALNNTSAADVWAYGGGRTVSNGGASATDVWSFTGSGGRTLTSPTPGSTTPPAISGSTLAIVRAVSFDVTVTGMVIPSNWEKIYFTVKSSSAVADTAALIQILTSNPDDAGDGLQYVNGAVAADAAQGTMVIDQGAGDATISITDDQTEDLVAGTYSYDLKVITDESKSTILASGLVTVGTPITLTV